MGKKFVSFCVMLLVTPSLIGSEQVFADATEPEQIQEQEYQMTNEVETSDSEEHIDEIEINELTKTSENSLGKTNQREIVITETEDHARESLANRNGDIASGTFGSAPWSIDQEGTLHIEAGVFRDTDGLCPWIDWSSDIQKIVFEGKVSTESSMDELFCNLKNVKIIENLSNLDTSNASSMMRVFSGMTSLASLDVSNFDTSNVYEMSDMFSGMASLTSLDVSNFDTSNVKYMIAMFKGATSLTSLDVSSFDTSNVKDIAFMFSGMTSLTSLDVSNFDTSNIPDSSRRFAMFSGLSNMKSLTLGDKMRELSDTELFDLKFTDVYDGNWLHVLSNQTFTSWELMQAYDGSLVGEYIWAFRPTLKVQDLILYEGNSWSSKDNFISATGRDGNPVAFEDVTVQGTVDTTKAGTYYVTYTYDDVVSVATITVKAIQTAVNVHDSTIYVGTAWEAENNFDSVIDKEGNPVDFKDVTVEDTVDTTEAGTYEVKYSYDGVTSVATITVKAIQTAVNVHDSTLYIGTEWEAENNFDSAIDKEGNPVDFKDVIIEGTVDTTEAGTYEVKYSYDGVTSVATITVKVIQTAVNVHDSTIYVGTEWEAENNFDSAIDKEGNPVDFKDVTVEGTVDTTKAGTYEVKYSYDGVTSVATIIIRNKKKDSTPNNDNNKGRDSQSTGEKALPQTGEQTNTIWTLIGFLTVLLSLIYLVKKRKKSH